MTAAGLVAYRLLLGLAEPIAPLLLKRRAGKGKEDGGRLAERLGHASHERPAAPLVWMHGASVGETLSLLPLVERLHAERPDIAVLITSGTAASAELLAKRLPPFALHQYLPVDAPAAAARFLDHWRPDLAVFAESELWPNLLLGAKARGARLALVSARITARTAAGWAKLPGAARSVFGAFDLVLPQDDASAERLEALGARIDGRLNLKLAGAPLPVDEAALTALQAELDGRPLLLAASTHPGEEEMVLSAYAKADPGHGALLVIAPRHVERGPGLAEMARGRGYSVNLRSAGDAPGAADVHVADTLGELGLWFRAATAAYVGGGMSSEIGGHNPLEAARLDCPVISGPQVRNWAEVYAALQACAGVSIVRNADELGAAFARALSHPRIARGQATRARALVEGQAQAMEDGWERLRPLLPPKQARR